jgi:hypothetical protein
MGKPDNRKETIMTTSPAHKIRIGDLSAIIWRNPHEKGAWYSVQPQRSYKNGDDEWRQTETMVKLLDQAHAWIVQQMEADRKARKEQAAA